MNGKLYIVATPIGNLKDISQRALEILESADLIAAEDTRNTQALLNHFGIHKKLVANHKFNERNVVDSLVSQLLSGMNIAVVSDAGTPCVNDPGYVLAKASWEAGVEVVAIPGACAAVTAVSASGLPSASFAFKGFFPREKKDAISLIDTIREGGEELYIFYESPMRIINTIGLLKDNLPESTLCLCNDLTKLHERIYRGTPENVWALLNDNPNATKGEYCLLVYMPPLTRETEEDELLSPEAYLVDYVVKHGCTMKEAISALALNKTLSYTKKDFYNASLRLKEEF